ncbi:hypothetical protein Tco_1491317 [Tanacetum coccineum]
MSISAAKSFGSSMGKEGIQWMTPIFKYLTNRTLPAEGNKARAVKRKSWRHTIRRGKGLADWLLLANHARGRKKLNSSMPNCQVHKPVPKGTTSTKDKPITSP